MNRKPISELQIMIVWTASALALIAMSFVFIVAFQRGSDHSVPTAGPPTSAPGTKVATCPSAAGLTGTFTDKGGEVVPGASFKIEAGDSYFGPTCALGVPKGPVSVTFTNTGQQLHNVSIPDQGIDSDIAPGESVTVKVTVGATPVAYFCKYHRTSGMVGALSPA